MKPILFLLALSLAGWARPASDPGKNFRTEIPDSWTARKATDLPGAASYIDPTRKNRVELLILPRSGAPSLGELMKSLEAIETSAGRVASSYDGTSEKKPAALCQSVGPKEFRKAIMVHDTGKLRALIVYTCTTNKSDYLRELQPMIDGFRWSK